MMPRGGGAQLFLIDTSAYARRHHPRVAGTIGEIIADGAAATCVTVDLEAGYSGRTASDVEAIRARRKEFFVVLPVSESIAERAREVQAMMAMRGHHRSPPE